MRGESSFRDGGDGGKSAQSDDELQIQKMKSDFLKNLTGGYATHFGNHD
jgi:hypothetical protein